MAHPLTSLLDEIAEDWEALTPPDRTTIRYHVLDELEPRQGTTSDRGIVWDVPDRIVVESESAGTAQTRWACSATLRLGSAGRSRKKLREAVIAETALLMQTIERRTSWPAGVWSVETGDSAASIDPDTEDVLVSLAFEALVGEV